MLWGGGTKTEIEEKIKRHEKYKDFKNNSESYVPPELPYDELLEKCGAVIEERSGMKYLEDLHCNGTMYSCYKSGFRCIVGGPFGKTEIMPEQVHIKGRFINNPFKSTEQFYYHVCKCDVE